MPKGKYKRKSFTNKHRKNISKALMGNENNNGHFGSKNGKWRGNKVSYRALHSWIERTLGKSNVCEVCGIDDLSGHKIHWANKSGRYKRIKSDWIRLCAKCHKQYDKERGTHIYQQQ